MQSGAVVTLEKDDLKIAVHPMGAELKSLLLLQDNYDYLWPGSKTGWAFSSPILFPIVGGLPDDVYLHRGKTYRMSPHGFARDCQFLFVTRTNDRLQFQLEDTEETRAMYPFEFKLDVECQLLKNTLKVVYRVRNKGNEPLPYSIGGHPAFRWPLHPDADPESHFLEFEHEEKTSIWQKANGVLTGQSKPFATQDKRFWLKRSLFRENNFLFKELRSRKLRLCSEETSRSVEIKFDGFDQFGIWTQEADEARFICLEPFCGLDSQQRTPEEIERKAFIHRLQPTRVRTHSYFIALS